MSARKAVESGLIGVQEVAELLGLKEGTVRAWLARRILPRVSVGRSVKVPRSAVAEFISRNTTPDREGRHA